MIKQRMCISCPDHHKKKKRPSDSHGSSTSASAPSSSPHDGMTAMGLLQAITSPTAVGSEPCPTLPKKPSYPSLPSAKDRRRESMPPSKPAKKKPHVMREVLPMVGEEVELEGEEQMAGAFMQNDRWDRIEWRRRSAKVKEAESDTEFSSTDHKQVHTLVLKNGLFEFAWYISVKEHSQELAAFIDWDDLTDIAQNVLKAHQETLQNIIYWLQNHLSDFFLSFKDGILWSSATRSCSGKAHRVAVLKCCCSEPVRLQAYRFWSSWPGVQKISDALQSVWGRD